MKTLKVTACRQHQQEHECWCAAFVGRLCESTCTDATDPPAPVGPNAPSSLAFLAAGTAAGASQSAQAAHTHRVHVATADVGTNEDDDGLWEGGGNNNVRPAKC